MDERHWNVEEKPAIDPATGKTPRPGGRKSKRV
jgi:hypothetical protein